MTHPEERVRRLPFAFTRLDPSVRRDTVYLEATDTAQSFGILYRPANHNPTTVVYLMHPRLDGHTVIIVAPPACAADDLGDQRCSDFSACRMPSLTAVPAGSAFTAACASLSL